MVFDKKRATNRLLFALSRHPQGMTTRELAEFIQQSNCVTCSLLRDSSYPREDNAEGGSIDMPAALWKLRQCICGSASEEDLKKRIEVGSSG